MTTNELQPPPTLLILIKSNNAAASAFEKFLHPTQDSDLLGFILEVEEFRRLEDSEEVRSRALAIYYKYFAGQKPKLASEEIVSALKCKITSYSSTNAQCAPPRDLFDEIEQSRINYLENEWLQRFYASDQYKSLNRSKLSSSSKGLSYLEKFIRRGSNEDASELLQPDKNQKKKESRKEYRNSRDLSRELSVESPKRYVINSPKSNSATELTVSVKPSVDASQKMTSAFEEILLEPSFTIIKMLCDAEASKLCRDELFTSVVNLFVHNDLIVSLLKLQFRHEIQHASTTHPDPSTLFRGESAAIKLMSRYFALEGKMYLNKFVRPLVIKICQSGSLEVNKQKVDPGEDIMANSTKLLMITQEFLDNFCQSPNQCPLKFRHVFTTVKRELKNYFPGLVDAIVGSLLFLRFICPAITCPQKYGIDEMNPEKLVECQRSLILVSKLLQNLVNGVEFDGTKEMYMTGLNCFITKNVDSLQNFFKIVADEELLAYEEKQSPQQTNPRSLRTVEACLSSIRNFMIDHKDVLWDQMSQRPALMSKLKNLVFFGLTQIEFVGDSAARQR
eukprot:TRINITY_DN2585_c0_g2_i1.p1 TRINITY_DN2585_c0_g2~~TRINITY_DN2585_c0_g2_i1.p1  ORF type:complete len:562 (+),score=85.83 TRINITY_DN2585_c0_g2_i1:132-1817(+)